MIVLAGCAVCPCPGDVVVQGHPRLRSSLSCPAPPWAALGRSRALNVGCADITSCPPRTVRCRPRPKRSLGSGSAASSPRQGSLRSDAADGLTEEGAGTRPRSARSLFEPGHEGEVRAPRRVSALRTQGGAGQRQRTGLRAVCGASGASAVVALPFDVAAPGERIRDKVVPRRPGDAVEQASVCEVHHRSPRRSIVSQWTRQKPRGPPQGGLRETPAPASPRDGCHWPLSQRRQ
jgi:hypothetical protein